MRRLPRRRPDAPGSAARPSPARSFGTSAGAFHGRIGCRRSTRLWHSHDLAAATVRSGISAACRRANSPTAKSRPAAQGRSSAPPPASCAAAKIEKTRQHGPRFDRRRRPQAAGSAATPAAAARRPAAHSQHAVGRAEVDSDDVFGRHANCPRMKKVNQKIANQVSFSGCKTSAPEKRRVPHRRAFRQGGDGGVATKSITSNAANHARRKHQIVPVMMKQMPSVMNAKIWRGCPRQSTAA